MKKTDLAHDTNLPYFLQRHPNGWAFYNRNYCNTITGIDQGADTDPATVEIPTHELKQLNGGGEHITDYSTARRIYLHDGSLGRHSGAYFAASSASPTSASTQSTKNGSSPSNKKVLT